MAEGERSLAIFIDFENLALGFQGRRDRFDIARVLERLVEKGKVVSKKAYADWNRFSIFTFAMHEAAIELIEIPRRGQTGKNSADIRLCVDAMDLAYSKEHINTFVILSGDSDFSPLVSKLKELGKHVIGLGMQDSTSDLLRDNCDEFIYYEDLGQDREMMTPSIDSHLPDPKRKAFALLLESLLALRRENKEVLWSSMVKDTMKRKKPSFNETYHGYSTFSELLEDAQREGLLELETDKRSRTYVVTRFGSEMHAEPERPQPELAAAVPGPAVVAPRETGNASDQVPAPGPKKSRRRRRRRGAAEGNGNGAQVARPVPPVAPPTSVPVPAPEPEPEPEPVPVHEHKPEPEPLPQPRHEREQPSAPREPTFAEGLDLPPEVPVAPAAARTPEPAPTGRHRGREPRPEPRTEPAPERQPAAASAAEEPAPRPAAKARGRGRAKPTPREAPPATPRPRRTSPTAQKKEKKPPRGGSAAKEPPPRPDEA